MQPDTLDRIHQQLLKLSNEKLQAVLNFVADLSPSSPEPDGSQSSVAPAERSNAHLNSPVPVESTQPSPSKQTYDITKTKTWSAIGKYQIPNPDPQYIVSPSGSQEIVTNYAEHVDDALYPSTDSI